MDKNRLDIVSLIENNRISCFNNSDNNKLITKLQNTFTSS